MSEQPTPSPDPILSKIAELEKQLHGLAGKNAKNADAEAALKQRAGELNTAVAQTHDRLSETIRILDQTKNLLNQAEEARKKADNEATYAFQAKNNAEAHAKFIAEKKGQVDADFIAMAATKKNTEEIAQTLANVRSKAEGDATAISGQRTTVEETVRVISDLQSKTDAATNAILQARTEVETSAKEVQGFRQLGKDEGSAITSLKSTAATDLEELKTTAGSVGEIFNVVGANAASVEAKLTDATTAATSIQNLVAKLTASDKIAEQFKTQLAASLRDYKEAYKKIEELLPAATSTGLASSFARQRARFRIPQLGWCTTFVLSILGLIVIAICGFFQQAATGGKSDSWDSITHNFLQKRPLAIPIAVLAYYASRRYITALRIEEDYAFKEALSTAFEGYKKQLQGIAGVGTNAPPLNVLCEKILW